MANPFRSVAQAQAFASAFSKSTAKDNGKPKLTLNESLHSLAVASDFKNWPTMKAHLESVQSAGEKKKEVSPVLSPLGVMEVGTLFKAEEGARNFTYSSAFEQFRLQAMAASIRSAKKANMDVVVIDNDHEIIELLDLDYGPHSLQTSPEPLLQKDQAVSVGYALSLMSKEDSLKYPLGDFLQTLHEFQKKRMANSTRADKQDVRSLHLIFNSNSASGVAINESKQQSTNSLETLNWIAGEGRKSKISVGFIYDLHHEKAGQGGLEPLLASQIIKNSISLHTD